MTAPNIDSSTREERLDYVLNEWRCLHNCEICGKCHVLKGRSEEKLYVDYIDVYLFFIIFFFFLVVRDNDVTEIHISIVVPGGGSA